MGTPDFAVPSLDALVQAGHDVCAVVTNPDRRSGRGRQKKAPPVKVAAQRLSIEAILQPPKLRGRELAQQLRAFEADFFVVAAYGNLLAPRYLEIPKIAPVNVHASLLPRYRGSAPIHWCIVRGESQSGVCIMKMERGMDTGGVYHRGAVEIRPEDTVGSLHDRLAPLGARLLVEALPGIADGSREAAPQDHALATHAPMLSKADGAISFDEPARVVHNRIRGMTPWPGAFCLLEDRLVTIKEATLVDASTPSGQPPGRVLEVREELIVVACAVGAVGLKRLQPSSRPAQDAKSFCNGYHVVEGSVFTADPRANERKD